MYTKIIKQYQKIKNNLIKEQEKVILKKEAQESKPFSMVIKGEIYESLQEVEDAYAFGLVRYSDVMKAREKDFNRKTSIDKAIKVNAYQDLINYCNFKMDQLEEEQEKIFKGE